MYFSDIHASLCVKMKLYRDDTCQRKCQIGYLLGKFFIHECAQNYSED
jgi:hypothetical protein